MAIRRSRFIAAVGALCAGFGAPAPARAALPRCAILVGSDGSATPTELTRFSARLGGALIRSGRWILVDRKRLDAVIREQGFSNSAYADPKTAAALGKIAGASRILHVDLTIETEASGGAFVQQRQVTANATFELVSVDAGRILAEGTATGTAEESASQGARISTPSRRAAVDVCADDLVTRVNAS